MYMPQSHLVVDNNGEEEEAEVMMGNDMMEPQSILVTPGDVENLVAGGKEASSLTQSLTSHLLQHHSTLVL